MTEITTNTAPTEAPDVATSPPAPETPVKRLTPTAVALLARDDGTLVLRAESPDAVDGFYNVDRDENSPQARRRMRRRGQDLARQYKIQFTDFTPPEPPVAVAKPAPKRAPLSAGRSQTATALRHRAEHLGLIFRKSHRRGPPIAHDRCGYRLLTASGEVILGAHFDAALTDIASYLETRFAPPPPNAQPGTSESTVRRRAKRLGYAVSKSWTGFQLIAPGGEVLLGPRHDATPAEIAAFLATREAA